MPSQQLCPQCKRSRWIPRYTAPWCTPSCKRDAQLDAELAASRASERALIVRAMSGFVACCVCCVCGHAHQAGSTGVLYRSLDHRWQCRNELACRERERQREADVAAMQRGLDQAWAALAAEGWRL